MFDASLWAFVGLVLFLALLVYLKVPGKIGSSLDEQADNIKSELEGARKLREEAQAVLAEYQRKRTEAEAEAEQIVADAKVNAERMTKEAAEALEGMIARRTQAAENKIAQAEASAIAEVKAKAADIAVQAAEVVLTDVLKDTAASDKVTSDAVKVTTGLLQ
ncbi:ATP F0F1 synthase subunit B [Polycladidibacter hongkongensis]|uniref:F0F1 ATP synthase subunit B family protein n=1 Tax=Polycladidibacter hongkongensis TaxID=1647556 RepID=UPI00082E4F2A|nr:ATP F0F1 synthase subunit B [Pseudovibrio hongkongensis]